jgi:post-segregation antitoxin (ccd killing protein)
LSSRHRSPPAALPTQPRAIVFPRNITVAVDDDTYKRARIAAAERDTSLSALVKAYLQQLASQETETERLKRQEREIRSRIAAFIASDRLSREDLHGRSQ